MELSGRIIFLEVWGSQQSWMTKRGQGRLRLKNIHMDLTSRKSLVTLVRAVSWTEWPGSSSGP